MTISENKVRLNIIIPKDLADKIDQMADEAGMSRSAAMADLLEHGYKQASLTRKVAGNKYVLKALQLIFGYTPANIDRLEETPDEQASAAAKTARNTILKELRKLSMEEAQRDIDNDLGMSGEQPD